MPVFCSHQCCCCCWWLAHQPTSVAHADTAADTRCWTRSTGVAPVALSTAAMTAAVTSAGQKVVTERLQGDTAQQRTAQSGRQHTGTVPNTPLTIADGHESDNIADQDALILHQARRWS
jgi:hypothetical protein